MVRRSTSRAACSSSTNSSSSFTKSGHPIPSAERSCWKNRSASSGNPIRMASRRAARYSASAASSKPGAARRGCRPRPTAAHPAAGHEEPEPPLPPRPEDQLSQGDRRSMRRRREVKRGTAAQWGCRRAERHHRPTGARRAVRAVADASERRLLGRGGPRVRHVRWRCSAASRQVVVNGRPGRGGR